MINLKINNFAVWYKSLISVGFGYGDEDEFFLQGWVWDNETRPCPAPLSSLFAGLRKKVET